MSGVDPILLLCDLDVDPVLRCRHVPRAEREAGLPDSVSLLLLDPAFRHDRRGSGYTLPAQRRVSGCLLIVGENVDGFLDL